jgi:hypothetical protein
MSDNKLSGKPCSLLQEYRARPALFAATTMGQNLPSDVDRDADRKWSQASEKQPGKAP